MVLAAGCDESPGGGDTDAGSVPPGTDAGPLPPGTDGGPPAPPGVPPSTGEELPLPEAQATFYVSSSTGNDAWSGTLPEPNAGGTDGPRASLDAAAQMLADAEPGTHVLLRRGDEWRVTNTFEIGGATGTVDAPIVLGSYGEGAQPNLVSETMQTMIVRGSRDGTSEYFRVHDLRFTSSSPQDGQVAIYTGESFHPVVPHHLTFSSLTIEGNGAGMTMYGDDHLVHGSRIANNNFGMGIYMSGARIRIAHNEFENNGLPPPDVFVHSLYISNCDRVVFEHNEVHSATDGVKVRRTSNSVFRHNTFHDILAIGIHLGGDSEGGASNNRIEANTFYDNSTDIVIKSESGVQVVPTDGLVIANNIMQGGPDDFVHYGAHLVLTDVPAQNVSIVNNLIWEDVDGEHGIVISNGGPNIECANNVVGSTRGGEAYRLDGAVAASNNLDLDGAGFMALGLADVAAGDFTPSEQSTALIDQGTDVSGAIEEDYEGVARPQGAAFDIGPHEMMR